MGKMKIDILLLSDVIKDILTTLLQKCSLSSPLLNISFSQNRLIWLGAIETKMLNISQKKK